MKISLRALRINAGLTLKEASKLGFRINNTYKISL